MSRLPLWSFAATLPLLLGAAVALVAACGTDDTGGTPSCAGPTCDGGAGESGSTDSPSGGDGSALPDGGDADGAVPSSCGDGGAPGTLDPSFGDGGMVWLKYAGSQASGVAVQSDGKLIVVGATQAGFAVIRLLPTGALDPSFGTNGLVTTSIGNTGFYSAVAVQGDGRIVATGGAQFNDNRSYDFAVARYLADGGLDPSFGEAGVATTSFGPGPFQDDYPRSILVQPDGRILVGGYSETNSVTSTGNFALARYNDDGSLDGTFGNGGKVVIDVHGTSDAHGVVALLPGGKIVVAGGTAETTSLSAQFDVSAVRLNADGTLDTAFADAGVMLTGFGTMSNSPIAAATSDTLGRPVLAGRLPNAGGDDFAALRVLTTGALDTSFGDAGVVTTDLGSSESSGAILIQEDGLIVLVGTSMGQLALVRYSSNGTLDPTFGVGGRSLTPPPPGGSLPGSAAALARCNIVTAGTWSYVEGAASKNAIGIARFHR
jgi:uncharacterized delta-60 repeat protein